MEEIRRYARPDVATIMVGNKSDLNDHRAVSSEQGKVSRIFYWKTAHKFNSVEEEERTFDLFSQISHGLVKRSQVYKYVEGQFTCNAYAPNVAYPAGVSNQDA